MESLVYDNEKFKTTYNGANRFILVDCYENDQRITIFSSDTQLKMLSSSTKIGADGTFNTCPKLYKQCYIIMTWFIGMVTPAAFVLLVGNIH